MASGELEVVLEKTLAHTAIPSLFAYSPSLDLVAIGSQDQQVQIFRLNGQRVYAVSRKGGSLRADQLRWKPDGQLLAIAWSDSVIQLVGAESNKTVHQIRCSQTAGDITSVGWGSSLSNKQRELMLASKQDSFDINSQLWSLSGSSGTLDLPRDLTLLDIESTLPKLSVLLATGTSDDIFSSRSSLDALFRPLDPKDDELIDVLVAGTEDGQVHLSIYDSFVIGSFPSPVADQGGGPPPRLVLHTSEPHYSTHGLLFRSGHPLAATLSFVAMDLRFISTSSEFLSILASRSTALQNLLRYISQVQAQMASEWRSTQDLPSRFLRNINETLAEHNHCDIVQALYHSVVTGHTYPAMKEWLVDELQERGHKRWDKAVVSGLENLQRLTHQHMLPALERCVVILSRLLGIAKYQSSNDNLGFTSGQIELIMDTVTCLTIVSNKILSYAVEELELFGTFSTWLRMEIDRLASDSLPSDEATEKDALIDQSRILLYIQTCLMSSRLAAFFRDGFTDKETQAWDQTHLGRPMTEDLSKQLTAYEDDLGKPHSVPSVQVLYNQLERQSSIVFEQIAEAEKRNVHFGQPVTLPYPGNGRPLAMRMCSMDGGACSIYVAAAPEAPSIQIFRLSLKLENGISSVTGKDIVEIQLGEGTVEDFVFMNDSQLLVLWSSKDEPSCFISLSFRELAYSTFQSRGKSTTQSTSISRHEAEFATYTFPPMKNFVPQKFELGVKGGDTIDGTNLCVLGRDGLHYKVFTLPRAQVIPDIDVTMSQ